ncbi:hypothetical protein D3C80_1500660 [compost metagenome]
MHHHRTGNNTAAGHQRVHGHAVAAGTVLHELGRRQRLHMGADRPGAVIHIQLRRDRSQIKVGAPVGFQRPHVAPIRRQLGVGGYAGQRERVRPRRFLGGDFRDQILAEVMG